MSLYFAKYYQKNKEKLCEYRRNYYRENKRKEQEYAKEYRRKNREEARKYQKEYSKTLRGYAAHLVHWIKSRCTDKRHQSYKNYGAHGIKCLFTSQELYNWLVANSIDPRGLCIHRIDNNGDYTLGNIKFLGRSEHAILHNAQRRNNEN